jgi:citrate lyase beta subunit
MSAIELGATLYVPAINPSLGAVVRGSIPDLRSMVICLEDSIRDDQVDQALSRVAQLLKSLAHEPPTVSVYIRPRDVPMFCKLMHLDGIDRVDGFVLPKVTTQSLPGWLSALMHDNHRIMPTIEGEEAFDRQALARLCDQLRPYAERVSAVRIGGNDILGLLGIRRARVRTAYDGPLSSVIRDISGAFLPNGFAVAAPVFEHFSERDVLRREVEQDIEHGLLTKTAIHPSQIALIHAVYRPDYLEMAEARAILDREAPGVFGSNGSMCEPATHMRWAGMIVKRAQIYGVSGPDQRPDALVA